MSIVTIGTLSTSGPCPFNYILNDSVQSSCVCPCVSCIYIHRIYIYILYPYPYIFLHYTSSCGLVLVKHKLSRQTSRRKASRDWAGLGRRWSLLGLLGPWNLRSGRTIASEQPTSQFFTPHQPLSPMPSPPVRRARSPVSVETCSATGMAFQSRAKTS